MANKEFKVKKGLTVTGGNTEVSNLSVSNIMYIGNSTVNSVVNSTSITIGNSTVNSTINSSSISLKGSANALVNTSYISIGNSTVNVVSSNGTLSLSGSYITPFPSFRNKLINGNFNIWQRGTVNSNTQTYSADRWVAYSNTSSYYLTREAFTVGQTDVPNEPRYYTKIVVTSSSSSNSFCLMSQKIEDVRTLAGKTATLSFYAKANASKNIFVELIQHFGTGGSSDVTIPVSTVALTTSWQKFILNIDIPSISGKSINTSISPYEQDLIQLVFWFDAGTAYSGRTNSLGLQSGTFDIAQVQLEEGKVATPFEIIPIQTELELCQRYYCSTGGNIYYVAQGASETHENHVYWPVQMRNTPTVSVRNDVADLLNRLNVVAGTPNVYGSSVYGGRFSIQSVAAGVTYAVSQVVFADAEL